MSEKTYAVALQTALENDATVSAYNKRVYVVNEEDDRPIEEIAQDLISQHKNIIIIDEVELTDSEDFFSNGGEMETYRSVIYAVNKVGKLLDKTSFLNLPVFGSPRSSTDLSTASADIKNALHNNKLGGDFLNMGGGIVSSERALTVEELVNIKANVHEGQRVTC